MDKNLDINFDDYIENNIIEKKIKSENNKEKNIEAVVEKKKVEKNEINIIDSKVNNTLVAILKKEENIELLVKKLNKKFENSSITKIDDEMDNLLSKIKETEIYLITLKKETAENVKLLEEQIINNTVSRMEIMYKSLNNVIKSLDALNSELNFDKKNKERENKDKYKKLFHYISISIFIFLIGLIFFKRFI